MPEPARTPKLVALPSWTAVAVAAASLTKLKTNPADNKAPRAPAHATSQRARLGPGRYLENFILDPFMVSKI
jgi:hypothetical protein